METALKSPLRELPWFNLFDHDAKCLGRLSDSKRVDAQFALLKVDTAKVIKESQATMVRICLTFAKFVLKSTKDIKCVRQVFEQLVQDKIGLFYKQTYESWCTLELQSGDVEMALKAISSSLKCNVLTKEEVEETFTRLKRENNVQETTVSEPTITLTSKSSQMSR